MCIWGFQSNWTNYLELHVNLRIKNTISEAIMLMQLSEDEFYMLHYTEGCGGERGIE